ncbi:MAG: purine-nucleoside phosphorylase [Acidobacteriota bacterium]|nr:purine-nucleoside phosphorylase [Acidobacteriota bacterium]
METFHQELQQAVEAWDEKGWPRPQALAVAGSGLAVELGKTVYGPAPLSELLPFPVHSIEGHPHSFEIVEALPDRPVLYLRGRLHAYQGYSGHQVVFPVRLAALLGASVLVMTNAAGGLRPELVPGSLVLLEDQINLTGTSPLLGQLPGTWGPQFPDMSQAYSRGLRERAQHHAQRLDVDLQRGVYAGVLGPAYETPAEVRMLAALGADVVGMSTVQEVIAARQMGLACCCISLVSNHGAGVSGETLHHGEVLAAGQAAADDVQRLLTALLQDPELLRAIGC